MKDWNIQKLLPLLKECGEIAFKYYDNPPIEIKADQSVVTAADKAIEKRLAEEFDRPDAGVYLIGEETIKTRSEDYLHAALNGTAWIVDPIDGTAPYSAHMPAWGISVALMKNGKIVEGAIYMPVQNKCLITDGEKVLHYTDVTGEAAPQIFVPVFRRLSPDGIISISQKAAKSNLFDMPNQLFSWSGCVASFYYLFTGKVMAYIVSVKLWDAAACMAILERSNFIIRGRNGKNLSTQVDNTIYDLDAESAQRWKLRGYAIAAGSDDIIDFILENSNLPEL
jgi:fructose-1,6-bisphosphatase/inositol monophosphatase family enzyme